MEPGAIVTKSFEIQSTGTEAVTIGRLGANCGCTTPFIDHEIIKSGESARITVSFNSAGYSRAINKQVLIESNDPDRRLAIIYLHGYVRIGIRADATTLDAGQAPVGSIVKAEMHLIRDTGRDVGIITAVDDPRPVTTSAGPWERYLEAERSTVAFKIAVADQEVGPHHSDVMLRAGGENLPVRLEYEVIPIVSYSPSEVVVRTNSMVGQVIHLSWTQHHPKFAEVYSSGKKCETAIVNQSSSGCDLVVTPRIGRTDAAGDFDIVRVLYVLPDIDRSEALAVPVVFLPSEISGR